MGERYFKRKANRSEMLERTGAIATARAVAACAAFAGFLVERPIAVSVPDLRPNRWPVGNNRPCRNPYRSDSESSTPPCTRRNKRVDE